MNVNELLKLPSARLKRIVELRTKIEHLESQLAALVEGAPAARRKQPRRKKGQMSAAARKRISLAAKARWAKWRAARAR